MPNFFVSLIICVLVAIFFRFGFYLVSDSEVFPLLGGGPNAADSGEAARKKFCDGISCTAISHNVDATVGHSSRTVVWRKFVDAPGKTSVLNRQRVQRAALTLAYDGN